MRKSNKLIIACILIGILMFFFGVAREKSAKRKHVESKSISSETSESKLHGIIPAEDIKKDTHYVLRCIENNKFILYKNGYYYYLAGPIGKCE